MFTDVYGYERMFSSYPFARYHGIQLNCTAIHHLANWGGFLQLPVRSIVAAVIGEIKELSQCFIIVNYDSQLGRQNEPFPCGRVGPIVRGGRRKVP